MLSARHPVCNVVLIIATMKKVRGAFGSQLINLILLSCCDQSFNIGTCLRPGFPREIIVSMWYFRQSCWL